MGDMLKTGSDWLEDQRHAHLTRTVEYHRGAQSVELAATVGASTFEVRDDYVVVEELRTRDYLFLTADLLLGGIPALPEPGDLIKERLGCEKKVFEVLAPGGEPPWRYSDPWEKTLRVHTKQVDEEP